MKFALRCAYISAAALVFTLGALAQSTPAQPVSSQKPATQPATAQPMTPQALSSQPTSVAIGAPASPSVMGGDQAQAPGSAATTPQTSAPVAAGDMLIGAGDLLTISVLGAPEYTQDLRVDSAGDVSLALAGPVHIAGLTVAQAQEEIRKRLMDGGYFADPQVSLLQKEFATQGVSVLGEVTRPGVYPLLGPHTLFDALSMAGGTTQLAGSAITISHRANPEKQETVAFANDGKNSTAANVKIYPGDTVIVAKAGVVYVVGEVTRPTGVVMNSSGITVLQAIAMAEGPKTTAALNRSRIVRRTPEGPKEIPISLKKILAAKEPDVKLQPEDIVFVPSSAAKSVLGRTADTAIRLATGVVAYRALY
jgi:polysaccharide biosynthesis/export protein